MTVKASWDVVSELMSEAYFAHVECFTATPFDEFEDHLKDLEDRREAAALSVGWTIEEVVAAEEAEAEAFYDSLEEAPPLPDYDFTTIHMVDYTDPFGEE